MSEIEFGSKIVSSPKLITYLRKNFKSGPVSSELKKIYKKPGGEFFFRITTETIGNKTRYFFSLKEDILSRGQAAGMKISKEVDLEINLDQLRRLTKIIELLEYKMVDEIKKVRESYLGAGVKVTIDHYPTNDYLEVEGPTQEAVSTVVKVLPFTALAP